MSLRIMVYCPCCKGEGELEVWELDYSEAHRVRCTHCQGKGEIEAET
jgi:hypothetical protein